MIRKALSVLSVGASLAALAHGNGAAAQGVPQGAAGVGSGEEIIVTARRKDENLLDVPESVAVVSAEQVDKYNILRMVDVQKLVPGLTLSDSRGFYQNTSMRGITFNQTQALPQTVAFYLNDVLVRPQHVYQAFFDIGQIEVLRGPQGTLRGEISPSGAITITTRRPDLDEAGGYAEASFGSLDNSNLQAAVGVPIIPGKLAIRVAAVRDVDSGSGVRSVFTSIDPRQESKAVRASMRFQPTEDLNAVITYQYLHKKDRSLSSAASTAGVFGSGSSGVPGNPNAPAGFNGPVIGLRDRLSIAPGPDVGTLSGHMVQGQVDWTFAGQKLSYIMGYGNFRSSQNQCATVPNTSPFPCFSQVNESTEHDWSHEVRLSNTERLFGHLDYTIGYFHTLQEVPTTNYLSPNYLSGAFGSPLGLPSPASLNPRYALNGVLSSTPAKTVEDAVFGSLTYHFTQNTEITAGVRWNSYRRRTATDLVYAPTFIALPLPQAACSGAGGSFGATYANVCDLPLLQAPFHYDDRTNENPIIYNFEASHHFNDDLMVYARFANSFRAGQTGLALLIQTQDPRLSQYLFSGPEKSKSYEAGVKGSLFDRKFQFELSYFHQDFDGYLYYTLPTYFLVTNGTPRVASTNITANSPAKVDGVEFTGTAFFSRDFSITGNFAWTNGRLKNALIPCNSSQFNGVADNIQPTVAQFQAANQLVALCKSNASTSTAPKFTFTVQSEYQHPITEDVGGFVRGLAYYYGRNPNASNVYVVPSYMIVDLHVGIRASDGRWELEGYSKNLLNDKTITGQGLPGTWASGLSSFFGATTGYSSVSLVARREFGVNLRYAFGSR